MHGRDAALHDRPAVERPVAVNRETRIQLGPNLVVAPVFDGVVRRNLEHTEAELRDLDSVVEGDVRNSGL